MTPPKNSGKAWMTERDADLFEGVLLRIAKQTQPRPLRVIEWGAGKSTLYFSKLLDDEGLRYQWVAVEHNRSFYDERLAKTVAERGGVFVDGTTIDPANLASEAPAIGLLAVVFNAGELKPMIGRVEDRYADLDEYVDVSHWLGWKLDLAIIDGRKRRRCLLAAAQVLSADGYALLDDANRTYYHCAFDAYASGRPIGDDLWIGSQRSTDFKDLVEDRGA